MMGARPRGAVRGCAHSWSRRARPSFMGAPSPSSPLTENHSSASMEKPETRLSSSPHTKPPSLRRGQRCSRTTPSCRSASRGRRALPGLGITRSTRPSTRISPGGIRRGDRSARESRARECPQVLRGSPYSSCVCSRNFRQARNLSCRISRFLRVRRKRSTNSLQASGPHYKVLPLAKLGEESTGERHRATDGPMPPPVARGKIRLAAISVSFVSRSSLTTKVYRRGPIQIHAIQLRAACCRRRPH